MSASFDCRCVLRLDGPDKDGLYAAVSRVSSFLGERPDIGLALLARTGAAVTLELSLEAENESAARAALEDVVTTIEIGMAREGVPGAVARGRAAVEASAEEEVEPDEEPPDLIDDEFVGTVLNGHRSLHERREPGLDLCAIPDAYERMRDHGTCGESYDLDTETIIERLEDWSDEYSFDVVEVGPTHVTLRFDRLPAYLLDLAAEAYELCPDLACEYDVEDEDDPEGDRAVLDAIAHGLREERVLRLWWD